MKDKTLLILAAGMGSRFGGLKQMEPIGPNGEFIIDYSIYDAIKNGFNKIVFLIKEEHDQLFKDTIGRRIESKLKNKNIKVEYVYQSLKNIENRANLPEERVKPYGTAHAILCTKGIINEPFVIINADDFYGNDAYESISKFIDNNDEKLLGVVGYSVINTLTENGSVKRGVCEVEDDKLTDIIESIIIKKDGKIEATPLNSTETRIIEPTTKVSMNMISFYPEYINYIDEKMDEFLKNADLLKDEFLIPIVMSIGIKEGTTSAKVIDTKAKWVGVTYKEDKDSVVEYINEQINNGKYPNDLWN
jgi:dTDP-glucose pyrophosphorylase